MTVKPLNLTKSFLTGRTQYGDMACVRNRQQRYFTFGAINFFVNDVDVSVNDKSLVIREVSLA